MGTFLSLSGVIGCTVPNVMAGLQKYAQIHGGGLEQAALASDHGNFCVAGEMNGNTSVVYPSGFLEWDEASAFLSLELKAPVFSFHIHDGDFWMYVLYVNGEVADRFNPIPDYWDEDPGDEEFSLWKGNPDVVAQYVKSIKRNAIANYLVRWDPDAEEDRKAYPGDEFGYEDWQLLDFLRKLKISYPFDNDGEATGTVYRLWANGLPLQTVTPPSGREKPWWKFW